MDQNNNGIISYLTREINACLYGCTRAHGNISNFIDFPSFVQSIDDSSLIKPRTKEEDI